MSFVSRESDGVRKLLPTAPPKSHDESPPDEANQMSVFALLLLPEDLLVLTLSFLFLHEYMAASHSCKAVLGARIRLTESPALTNNEALIISDYGFDDDDDVGDIEILQKWQDDPHKIAICKENYVEILIPGSCSYLLESLSDLPSMYFARTTTRNSLSRSC